MCGRLVIPEIENTTGLMIALILNQFIYILFTVWMAAHHAKLIEQHKRIYHGWWGVLAVAVAGLFWFINPWLVPVQVAWRALLFSPLLNLARQLPASYFPSTPKSIIDKIEIRLFKNNFKTRTVVYLTLLIIFEVILWVKH